MDQENFERKIAYGRAALWVPFYAVGVAGRIRGEISIELLEAVLCKLRTLHPPLASRVRMEEDGAAWLTTEGVGGFSLEVRPRTALDDWVRVFLEQERRPFAFSSGPVARFILLRGAESSDLIVIAPHVICDGYSMSLVMADVASLLNDPGRAVRQPVPPPEVTCRTIPGSERDNLLLKAGIKALNRLWPDGRTILSQDRYEDLHGRYWARQQNDALTFALTRTETSGMVARCKQQAVSVTSALASAFFLAQTEVLLGAVRHRREISVAVSIRDRMVPSPGTAVGLYASSVDIKVDARPGKTVWDLARENQAGIRRALGERPRVFKPMLLDSLAPSIVDEACTAVSTDQWGPGGRLLSHFVRVRGTVRSLTISNIGRIDLPETGGPYRLETVLPFPPLVPGNEMALNVLTVGGQMIFVLKFERRQMEAAAAAAIKDRAIAYLLPA